jgi:hypothetical protein
VDKKLPAVYYYKMSFFSMSLVPLFYLALSSWFSQSDGTASGKYTFFNGLFIAVPSVVLWYLFRNTYAYDWGSQWLIGSFLIRYWLLPFGFAMIGYTVTRGFSESRWNRNDFFAYLCGFISFFSAFQTITQWGVRDPVFTFVLTILTVVNIILLVFLIDKAILVGMPLSIILLFLCLVCGALTGIIPALFFMRLAWLGITLGAIISAISFIILIFFCDWF